MTITVKDWKDRPVALNPQAGETLAQWETRAAAYIAANPSLVTIIDAASMEDLETRLGAYADSQVGGISPTLLDAKGDVIAASADNVAARLPVGATNQVLTVDPATTTGLKWAAPAASGIQPTLVDAKGDLITASADDTPVRLPAGSNGQLLSADSAQTPGLAWTTVSRIPATLLDAKGDIIAATANDTAARLAVGSDGQVLTAASGQATGLQWAAQSGIQPTIVDAKGDVIAASAADTVDRLPAGTNGHVLTVDTAQTLGIKWAAAPGAGGGIAATIVDVKGDLIAATGNDAVARLPAGSNGQVLAADSAQSSGLLWTTLSSQTRPHWLPSDNGLLAATDDPGDAHDQIDTLNGEILWSKIWVPSSVTIANLVVIVSSPGSGFSTGNFAGLFLSNGTLISKSAEQSTPWATAGTKSIAQTVEGGQSLTQGGAGAYLIAVVMSRATTRPLFRCEVKEDAVNLNLTGLGLRSGSDGSDLSRVALPSTITAGNQVATFRQIWMGLS